MGSASAVLRLLQTNVFAGSPGAARPVFFDRDASLDPFPIPAATCRVGYKRNTEIIVQQKQNYRGLKDMRFESAMYPKTHVNGF